MTAEIAIINTQGIALAADSAVTIGRSRVWKTANKLFSLGPINDIAIMIYNSGDFVGVPWEVIIKSFRENLGKRRFSTLRQCEIAFFTYLNTEVFSRQNESDFSAVSILMYFVDLISRDLQFKTLSQLQIAIDLYLPNRLAEIISDTPLNEVMPKDVFLKKFVSDIGSICRESFGFRLTKSYRDRVAEFLYEMFIRRVDSLFMSGIVFAGYGSDQLMPCMSHYIVDGRMEYNIKKQKFAQTRFWVAQRCDLSQKSSSSAYVYPFAQLDIFYLFMEGIIPRYITYLSKTLKGVLDDKSERIVNDFVPPTNRVVEQTLQNAENEQIVEAFQKSFEGFRHETLVSPVIEVIRALPKEEMAAMAEALVELTALRRKVGSNLESVGGPTDVAVISKGEGLIWIKRKHYFVPGLNSDYVARKKIRLEDAPNEEG